MNKEKFMKNGVFSLEYDKETLKDMVLELQDKLEAYENMRKEAIEYIKNNQTPISEPSTTLMKLYGKCLFEKHCEDLLNILNKVGGSDE